MYETVCLFVLFVCLFVCFAGEWISGPVCMYIAKNLVENKLVSVDEEFLVTVDPRLPELPNS